MPKKFLCLGVETSCDETAAAVVESPRDSGVSRPVILSNVVRSQAKLHKIYGGVVPEIAGRAHLESILPVIHQALKKSGKKLTDLDAIAVNHTPGLIGALLIGVSAAKSLSLALNIPLIGVNHLEAHLYAWQLRPKLPVASSQKRVASEIYRLPVTGHRLPYPAIGLVASGGHTSIYLVKSPVIYVRLGGTVDDAAGEAFDKVAHILGLGYPGGPLIEKIARRGNPQAIKFPRPDVASGRISPKAARPEVMTGQNIIPRPEGARLAQPGWAAQFNFSFSGLKTAVLYYAKGQNASRQTPLKKGINIPDIAASFQETVAQTLVDKVMEAVSQLSVISHR